MELFGWRWEAGVLDDFIEHKSSSIDKFDTVFGDFFGKSR
jgi:hypothetical protein